MAAPESTCPHLRSSIAIGPRRCRLAGSLPRSALWDARGAEPRSVAVPSVLVARSWSLCLMYANLGTRAVRRAPEGISSAPRNLRVLSVRAFSSGSAAVARMQGRGHKTGRHPQTLRHRGDRSLAVSKLLYHPEGCGPRVGQPIDVRTTHSSSFCGRAGQAAGFSVEETGTRDLGPETRCGPEVGEVMSGVLAWPGPHPKSSRIHLQALCATWRARYALAARRRRPPRTEPLRTRDFFVFKIVRYFHILRFWEWNPGLHPFQASNPPT